MTDLTPEMIDEVCKDVEDIGLHAHIALERRGIKRATAKGWLRAGEELELGHGAATTKHQQLCLALWAGVCHAEAELEKRWNVQWNAANEKALLNGKANGFAGIATRLERRFPERYKRVSPAEKQVEESADEFFRRQAEQREKEQGGGA